MLATPGRKPSGILGYETKMHKTLCCINEIKYSFWFANQPETSNLLFSGKGHPTEWRHFTNSPFPRASRTDIPIRVIILMLATTYGESVSSIPNLDKGESSGPMLKGMTYIVRPAKKKQRKDLGGWETML